MSKITRRAFAQAAAFVGMTAATVARGQTSKTSTKPATTSATSPSDRVRLAFIGVGNRGDQVLSGFLKHADAEIVAVADLHQPYLNFAAKKIGSKTELYKDYRRVLDRKDIDAVVINTPDHWHALQMIQACQAGKDVYVEKPLSLCVAEGRAMANAAAHYKRVTQVGIQRRSSHVCQEMAEFIRGGGIGRVTFARAFHIQNEWPKGIGRPADSELPKDFDWDAWLGPAPMRTYNVNRTFYRFRWFYDYSGGQLANMGVHYMDLIQWCLGKDAPSQVTAMGGKFADYDNREIPDTMEAMWTYSGVNTEGPATKSTTGKSAAGKPETESKSAGSTLVTFTQINANGAAAAAKPAELEFRGTKGTLYFRGGGWEVVPEEITQKEFPVLSPLDRTSSRNWRAGKPEIEGRSMPGPGDPTVEHARNFLDCVRSRAKCNCDIETGHRSTTPVLLANIAHKTKSLLEWDAKTERFTNNDAANELLDYEHRKPYELPKIGA